MLIPQSLYMCVCLCVCVCVCCFSACLSLSVRVCVRVWTIVTNDDIKIICIKKSYLTL